MTEQQYTTNSLEMVAFELAEACEIAATGKSTKHCFDAIHKIAEIKTKKLGEPALHLINAAIGYVGEIMREINSEKTIQENFFNNLQKYIPEAKEEKVKMDRNNIPDGFISIDNSLMPVEIKKDSFKLKDIKQLLRYIDFYSCNKGIAVAKEFNKKLMSRFPEIIFIEV